MNASNIILCVDDEPINLMILKKVLGKDYTVLTAESGMMGLEMLDQEPGIQYVISDMRMPGMNGLEFISEATQRYKDKKYFMLSGFNIDEEIQAALDSGLIAQYFVKPADFTALKKALQDEN